MLRFTFMLQCLRHGDRGEGDVDQGKDEEQDSTPAQRHQLGEELVERKLPHPQGAQQDLEKDHVGPKHQDRGIRAVSPTGIIDGEQEITESTRRREEHMPHEHPEKSGQETSSLKVNRCPGSVRGPRPPAGGRQAIGVIIVAGPNRMVLS